MASKLYLCGIEPESIVDGPGFRYVLFTQGCPHHCPGCHNPQTHPFEGGYEADVDAIFAEIEENPLISGVTLSGGEPFCQAEGLLPIAQGVKARGKHLMAFTGYTIEQLAAMAQQQPAIRSLLELCDTIVDGPFVQELRDPDLDFRGSSNQRVLQKNEILQALAAGQA